jgi:ferrochelatase
MIGARRKTAVVLFNLGGPDNLDAVRPFLFNLFNDRAIIGVPQPLRWLLARLISRRRAPVARKIYRQIGGRSPILEQTRAQAAALEKALGENYRVFVAMRYWHPFSRQTVREVMAWEPGEVVLLPLYPQFSTTTTGSSIKDWCRQARRAGLAAPCRVVQDYPCAPGLIAAQAGLIGAALDELQDQPVRLLLSAHGLPKKLIERGDPYQRQIEQTARAVVDALGRPDLDWTVCYQSRVGPLEWIGPATPDEIRRAGREGRAVVIAPIAFVSEHSETLVELDMDYRKLAREYGVPAYHRVAAVGTAPDFIAALADLVGNFKRGEVENPGGKT